MRKNRIGIITEGQPVTGSSPQGPFLIEVPLSVLKELLVNLYRIKLGNEGKVCTTELEKLIDDAGKELLL